MTANINRSAALYLASSSPRRQELIRMLGLPVVTCATHVDETVEPGLSPVQIVETLALRKAGEAKRCMLAEDAYGIVIGSDTIVVQQGTVLGKPRDEAEARRMLSALQGSTHEVYTGIACLETAAFGEQTHVGHTVSKVTFCSMDEEEIDAYVKTGEPMDKAGAYGVQGLGALHIERIEGDFYSVMGLPLNLLYRMLASSGIRPFQGNAS